MTRIPTPRESIAHTQTILPRDAIAPNVVVTPFICFNREGPNRDDRLDPQSYVGLSHESLTYSPSDKSISSDTLWAMIHAGSESDGSYWRANAFLPVISEQLPNGSVIEAHRNMNNAALNPGRLIDANQAGRVSRMYEQFRTAYRSKPFVIGMTRQGRKVSIHMNMRIMDEVMIPLERWFDFDYESVSTPKDMAFMPVGLGSFMGALGWKPPTCTGFITGFQGLWQMTGLNQIAMTKDAKWTMMFTFAAWCLLNGQVKSPDPEEQGSAFWEELLIRFAMCVETAIVNKMNVSVFTDVFAWLPLLNKFKLNPSFGSYMSGLGEKTLDPSRLNNAAQLFFLYYAFLKGVTALQSRGKITSLWGPTKFIYSGIHVPDPGLVTACFRVNHRLTTPARKLQNDREYVTVFTGPRKFFPIASNSDAYGNLPSRLMIYRRMNVVPRVSQDGRMIADSLRTVVNDWHIVGADQGQHIDPIPLDIKSFIPPITELAKNSLDMNILVFNTDMDVGVSSPINRTDLEDDELILAFNIQSISRPNRFDLVTTNMLFGGLPMWSIDSYLEFFSHGGAISGEPFEKEPRDNDCWATGQAWIGRQDHTKGKELAEMYAESKTEGVKDEWIDVLTTDNVTEVEDVLQSSEAKAAKDAYDNQVVSDTLRQMIALDSSARKDAKSADKRKYTILLNKAKSKLSELETGSDNIAKEAAQVLQAYKDTLASIIAAPVVQDVPPGTQTESIAFEDEDDEDGGSGTV